MYVASSKWCHRLVQATNPLRQIWTILPKGQTEILYTDSAMVCAWKAQSKPEGNFNWVKQKFQKHTDPLHMKTGKRISITSIYICSLLIVTFLEIIY